jgi:hypothetical protein
VAQKFPQRIINQLAGRLDSGEFLRPANDLFIQQHIGAFHVHTSLVETGMQLFGCPRWLHSFSRHNDNSRMLRQFHGGIEGTYHAILHNTNYGQGSVVLLKVLFHGGRHSVGRQV